MATIKERRQHKRVPVHTTVRCRRLGRGGFDEEVPSVDLSAGGMLLRADGRLAVGDVLSLELELAGFSLAFRGLVVAVREASGDDRFVHVAFTGLSPDRLATLADLLESWEHEAAGS
jgi:hypothetical protein